MKRFQTGLNSILAAILIFLFGVGASFYFLVPRIEEHEKREKEESTAPQRRGVVSEENAVIEVVERVGPSVVSVARRSVVLDIFGGLTTQEANIGTGFFVKKNLVLTNKHVVAEEGEYTVVLKDQTTLKIKEIHRDPFFDLAILKVPRQEKVTPVELGNSDSLKVGQKVVAIGNALGRLTNTVTTGVVSGLGRGVTALGPSGQEYLEDVIQTDAAINPGNSGGPLLDLSGRAVGINVAVTRGAENIGFAIPADVAKSALESMEQSGRIRRPFLGVRYIMLTEELAQKENLPQGAYVSEVVEDSGAAQAGIRKEDVILSMDEVRIKGKTTLARVIRDKKVGDKVTLKVQRGGKKLTLSATLGEAP